jgi:hypothetical protein
VAAFICADFYRYVVNEIVGKGDLFASGCMAAVRGIRPVRAAFGPNTEAPDRLASNSVRVKHSLEIFQIKREVQ